MFFLVRGWFIRIMQENNRRIKNAKTKNAHNRQHNVFFCTRVCGPFHIYIYVYDMCAKINFFVQMVNNIQ